MRRLTKTFALAAAATALVLTGGATVAAQQGGKKGPDANGDKIVTLAEHNAHADQMFAKMDVNGDGVINADDREARQGERFAKMDADGSGEVTLAEMKAMAAQREARRAQKAEARFAKLDTDNSGGLSEDEMEAARELRGERRGEADGTSTEGRGMRGGDRRAEGKRGGRHGAGPMAMLKHADTNGDKSVDRAEFDAAMTAHFAKADANRDGAISADERKAARAEMRGKWQKRSEARQNR